MTSIADLSMFLPTKSFFWQSKGKKSILGNEHAHVQRKMGRLQFCRKTEPQRMTILEEYRIKLQTPCSRLVIYISMDYLDYRMSMATV